MDKTQDVFVSDTAMDAPVRQVTVTGSLPFSAVKQHLSTRPLRRSSAHYGVPLTPDQHELLIEYAKNNPPPKAWSDEDFEGLQ